jgi:drug/metabolite transporter (DMT)-like permease
MNKVLVILGIVLIVVGVSVFAVSYYTTLIQNRTHRGAVPFGGVGLAVLGALMIAGTALMKPKGGKAAGQFKCAKCGATFGSQAALDQHSKDKHKI